MTLKVTDWANRPAKQCDVKLPDDYTMSTNEEWSLLSEVTFAASNSDHIRFECVGIFTLPRTEEKGKTAGDETKSAKRTPEDTSQDLVEMKKDNGKWIVEEKGFRKSRVAKQEDFNNAWLRVKWSLKDADGQSKGDGKGKKETTKQKDVSVKFNNPLDRESYGDNDIENPRPSTDKADDKAAVDNMSDFLTDDAGTLSVGLTVKLTRTATRAADKALGSELTQELTTFGYTQKEWSTARYPWLDSGDFPWEELPTELQDMFMKIGYDAELWQMRACKIKKRARDFTKDPTGKKNWPRLGCSHEEFLSRHLREPQRAHTLLVDKSGKLKFDKVSGEFLGDMPIVDEGTAAAEADTKAKDSRKVTDVEKGTIQAGRLEVCGKSQPMTFHPKPHGDPKAPGPAPKEDTIEWTWWNRKRIVESRGEPWLSWADLQHSDNIMKIVRSYELELVETNPKPAGSVAGPFVMEESDKKDDKRKTFYRLKEAKNTATLQDINTKLVEVFKAENIVVGEPISDAVMQKVCDETELCLRQVLEWAEAQRVKAGQAKQEDAKQKQVNQEPDSSRKSSRKSSRQSSRQSDRHSSRRVKTDQKRRDAEKPAAAQADVIENKVTVDYTQLIKGLTIACVTDDSAIQAKLTSFETDEGEIGDDCNLAFFVDEQDQLVASSKKVGLSEYLGRCMVRQKILKAATEMGMRPQDWAGDPDNAHWVVVEKHAKVLGFTDKTWRQRQHTAITRQKVRAAVLLDTPITLHRLLTNCVCVSVAVE